jgi:hypothetical protein
MSPGTPSRTLVATLALALALPALATAALGPAELREQLLPLYERLQGDPTYLALDRSLAGHLEDRAVVDRYLEYLPLSPLEIHKLDMFLKHYEVATPRILSAWHRRWVELHPAEAEVFYGEAGVEAILGGGKEGSPEQRGGLPDASVGTNRNSAATFSPSPLDYQGEIQVKVNPGNPNQIVSAANTWDDIGGSCGDYGLQAAFYSSDGGATWGYSCPPDDAAYGLNCSAFGGGTFGSDPALSWDTSGNVFLEYMLLCFTSPNTYRYSVVVAKSTNGGASWAAQGIVKSSWSSPGTVEDKNFYAIDTNAGSPFFGRHYTCWDRNNDEKFAYSTNGGASWTETNLPNVSIDLGCDIAVQDDGTVHVVWDTLTCGVQTCSNERMFYTRSTNGGVSWSSATQVIDYNLTGFSNSNCPDAQNDRCIGPFGTIAVDNSGGACDGTLYVTYTDYTANGVNNSDVWVKRSTDNGATWQTAVKVNDDGLSGRIQFHPYMEVDQGSGNVVVGWHDARNDSGNDAVDYFLARSTNCGVSFEANVQASQASSEFNNSSITYSDENSADNPGYNPNQYGEYMGVDALGGKAYLAWTDTRHYFPSFTSEPQKENVGFAVVDFGGGGGPVCGNGTIENPEVCDGSNLGGETCESQGFPGGGTLACAANCLSFDTSGCSAGGPTTVTFTSVASQDGWLRESSETSNQGGSADSNDTNANALRAGDNNKDRQYKLVVSFDTSSIPDGATVTAVTLRIKRGALTGTNPHATHGTATADVSSSGFGGSTALAASDFQAAATATAVATMSDPGANGVFSEGTLNAAGLAAINKTGTTQFRVQFSLDDNDDNGNDFLGYYSGEAAAGNQPELVVTYQ